MKKLTLKLEELAVESFETDGQAQESGTDWSGTTTEVRPCTP